MTEDMDAIEEASNDLQSPKWFQKLSTEEKLERIRKKRLKSFRTLSASSKADVFASLKLKINKTKHNNACLAQAVQEHRIEMEEWKKECLFVKKELQDAKEKLLRFNTLDFQERVQHELNTIINEKIKPIDEMSKECMHLVGMFIEKQTKLSSMVFNLKNCATEVRPQKTPGSTFSQQHSFVSPKEPGKPSPRKNVVMPMIKGHTLNKISIPIFNLRLEELRQNNIAERAVSHEADLSMISEQSVLPDDSVFISEDQQNTSRVSLAESNDSTLNNSTNLQGTTIEEEEPEQNTDTDTPTSVKRSRRTRPLSRTPVTPVLNSQQLNPLEGTSSMHMYPSSQNTRKKGRKKSSGPIRNRSKGKKSRSRSGPTPQLQTEEEPLDTAEDLNVEEEEPVDAAILHTPSTEESPVALVLEESEEESNQRTQTVELPDCAVNEISMNQTVLESPATRLKKFVEFDTKYDRRSKKSRSKRGKRTEEAISLEEEFLAPIPIDNMFQSPSTSNVLPSPNTSSANHPPSPCNVLPSPNTSNAHPLPSPCNVLPSPNTSSAHLSPSTSALLSPNSAFPSLNTSSVLPSPSTSNAFLQPSASNAMDITVNNINEPEIPTHSHSPNILDNTKLLPDLNKAPSPLPEPDMTVLMPSNMDLTLLPNNVGNQLDSNVNLSFEKENVPPFDDNVQIKEVSIVLEDIMKQASLNVSQILPNSGSLSGRKDKDLSHNPLDVSVVLRDCAKQISETSFNNIVSPSKFLEHESNILSKQNTPNKTKSLTNTPQKEAKEFTMELSVTLQDCAKDIIENHNTELQQDGLENQLESISPKSVVKHPPKKRGKGSINPNNTEEKAPKDPPKRRKKSSIDPKNIEEKAPRKSRNCRSTNKPNLCEDNFDDDQDDDFVPSKTTSKPKKTKSRPSLVANKRKSKAKKSTRLSIIDVNKIDDLLYESESSQFEGFNEPIKSPEDLESLPDIMPKPELEPEPSCSNHNDMPDQTKEFAIEFENVQEDVSKRKSSMINDEEIEVVDTQPRKRRTAAKLGSFKEPSLNKKMRQGDPLSATVYKDFVPPKKQQKPRKSTSKQKKRTSETVAE